MMMISAYAQKPAGYDEELEGMYKNSVELVSAKDVASDIKSKDIYLLDTREKPEFKVSHLKDSRWVGYNTFSIKAVADIPKDAEIVVYCSLGVRSEQIGEKLQNAGYTNVRNLYGGIFEWVFHDQPIVDKKEFTTDKVHTYDKNWSKWLLKGSKVY